MMEEDPELNRTLICPPAQPAPSLPDLSRIWKPVPALAEFLATPIVNPHQFKYVHNRQGICQERQTNILFAIPSAPGNFRRRDKVRLSPLGEFVRNNSNMATMLFFLGLPRFVGVKTQEVQKTIDTESKKHNDVIQEDFTDVYKNIRLKAVFMLKWVSTYCFNVTYVIRVDDDVRINVQGVVEAVFRVGRNHKNFVLGNVTKFWKVNRDPLSKYYVSLEEYPGPTYPPLAQGGMLAYPLRTVRLLYEASLRVRAVWLDDVYLTALCAPKVNATLLGDLQFTFVHPKDEPS
ncbi:lactosylceramide 1,3-N-acetyl-beta-D-glucosaminyltransferase-like [Aplysia californica]|uniref:Hexosyltransferase n=1 Tax=Aplysia californica TaxID=6500 RepID=A0ABM1A6D4_APLCA|nr:lactosylceramide 1,3-N-acetyl-beta-D-glucosaminyltransferase-like [Aplysia californica]